MTRFLIASLLISTAANADSFALITTNNKSLTSTRETLRFADDDGVHYAQLFSERFGAGHTVLLTELDEQTRALNPGYAQVPSPTRKHLDEAVATLKEALLAAKNRGATTELFLVFAGHGDVDQGIGFLELADQRFTSRDLEALLAALPADQIHLIVDSCNSYFLLNPRKPGGRRWNAEPIDTRELTARFPNVGTLISTNAEAVSYEWSELQSGIFSYEVRSGLRGAADVDADGQVTYRELAAFIERANEGIVNQSFRPRVAFSGPRGDAKTALLTWPAETTALQLDGSRARRLTVRDALGVRVLDVHQEAASPLLLRLPAGEHIVAEVNVVDGSPRTTMRVLAAGFAGALEQAPTGDLTLLRGDGDVFRALFREPFGQLALAAADAKPVEPAPVYGVSDQDIKRLDEHLVRLGQTQRRELAMRIGSSAWSPGSGLNAIGSAVSTAGLATASFFAPGTGDVLSRQARLLGDLPEERRATLFHSTERSFEQLALRARSERTVWGVVGIVAGAIAAIAIPIAIGAQLGKLNETAVAFLGAGVAVSVGSGIMLGIYRSPEERAWNDYASGTTFTVRGTF